MPLRRNITIFDADMDKFTINGLNADMFCITIQAMDGAQNAWNFLRDAVPAQKYRVLELCLRIETHPLSEATQLREG